MPAITVDLSGEHARIGREAGAGVKPVIHTIADWIIDPLDNGMRSGATALMVIIPVIVDGTEAVVMAETSLTCWMMASAVLASSHRDEVGQPGWAVMNPETRALLAPRYVEALRRAVPGITPDQADEAAEMFMDALAAGAPPEAFGA